MDIININIFRSLNYQQGIHELYIDKLMYNVLFKKKRCLLGNFLRFDIRNIIVLKYVLALFGNDHIPTQIFLSVKCKNLLFTEYFIDKGIQDIKLRVAMTMASENGSVDIMKYLCSKGIEYTNQHITNVVMYGIHNHVLDKILFGLEQSCVNENYYLFIEEAARLNKYDILIYLISYYKQIDKLFDNNLIFKIILNTSTDKKILEYASSKGYIKDYMYLDGYKNFHDDSELDDLDDLDNFRYDFDNVDLHEFNPDMEFFNTNNYIDTRDIYTMMNLDIYN